MVADFANTRGRERIFCRWTPRGALKRSASEVAKDCPDRMQARAARLDRCRDGSLARLEFLPDAGDGASLIGRIRQLHRQLLLLFGRGVNSGIIPDRWIEKRLRLGI